MAVTNSSKFSTHLKIYYSLTHFTFENELLPNEKKTTKQKQNRFETADGVKREEEGAQKQIGEEAGATSRGSWSYTAPEGDKIDLTFVADENGFQPQGAHLPVAPEPSPAIKRALAIIARTNAADEARAAGMSTKQKLQMLGLLDQRLGLRK